MLVTCEQMSEAEKRLFSSGLSPEPFMDEAGRICAHAIREFYPRPARAEIYCGSGNNGGDALVIARWLKQWGWKTNLHFSHGPDQISELATIKLKQYESCSAPPNLPECRDLVLVDGLLGIGATGALRGGIRERADQINSLRENAWAACFAIDIPTGLNADTGEAYEGAVIADYTLSICQAKAGFVADDATNYLGRVIEIPLDIPVSEGDESRRFLFPSNLTPRLVRREYDFHKGKAGRVVIVAGSKGLTGAAALTALGASRTGAGLVSVCAPEEVYPIFASQCPLEAMVHPGQSADDITALSPDVIAIGPGLGKTISDGLVDLILNHPAPMIVDADALNALAHRGISPDQLPANRLLTPHPGELSRLTGQTGGRVALTRKLADDWNITLLHKGARTVIATPGHPVELNTTGHPGMASGGMGDVLTGICAALVGQGLNLHDAACVGSWLLGRAAELARDERGIAAESINAPAVAEQIGKALRALQSDPPF